MSCHKLDSLLTGIPSEDSKEKTRGEVFNSFSKLSENVLITFHPSPLAPPYIKEVIKYE